jgi:hypothetical protein
MACRDIPALRAGGQMKLPRELANCVARSARSWHAILNHLEIDHESDP